MNSKSQANSLHGDANFVTGSIGSKASALQQSNKWATKWRKNPADPGTAIGYARSLRAAGQHQTAVQLLQQAALSSPKNQAVIAEYGKALSTVGNLKQAMHNLDRAQTLGSPDWRIYSAQGITLDRMAQHSRARDYYKSALNLKPNNSTILNNIGLSYALEGNLADAETYLRRAAAANKSQPKVRKNLALVLGLNGKFSQSAQASNEVLSSEETSANIAYLKSMLSPQGTWQKLSSKNKIAAAKRGKTKNRIASKPRKITTLETRKVTRVETKKITPVAKKKVTTLKKTKKAPKLKVSAKKAPAAKSVKSSRATRNLGPAKDKKLSAFSRNIEKAIAATQKTASVDHLNLRTD